MHTGQRRRRGTHLLVIGKVHGSLRLSGLCGGGLEPATRLWPGSGAAGVRMRTRRWHRNRPGHRIRFRHGIRLWNGDRLGTGTGTGLGMRTGFIGGHQQPAPAKPARNKQTVMSFFIVATFQSKRQ